MPPDPYEVLKEAASLAEPGYKGSRQMVDEFRQVFGTPQGKRVFNQIMEWGGFFRNSVIKGDPYATHVREGERNIAAHIWATLVSEPKERPTETNRRTKNG